MVKKKSAPSKAKSRRDAYRRQATTQRHSCSGASSFARSHDAMNENANAISENCVNVPDSHITLISPDISGLNESNEDLNIIQKIMKRIVSKVSRLDAERKRQSELRKRNKLLKPSVNDKSTIIKNIAKNNWFRDKYRYDLSFRKKRLANIAKYLRDKYKNNTRFREDHQLNMKMYVLRKYHNNKKFREKEQSRIKINAFEKYQNDREFRQDHQLRIKTHRLKKYHSDSRFRQDHQLRMKMHRLKKYHTDRKFRQEHQLRMKMHRLKKYQNDREFRQDNQLRMKMHCLKKYHNDREFREEHQKRMKMKGIEKYRTNRKFRQKHQAYMKKYVWKKYHCNNEQRLRKIKQASNYYKKNRSLIKRNLRRIYNRKRRFLRERFINDSQMCLTKHNQMYISCLNSFRKLATEGPDYICVVCGLTLFRTQVIPYVEKKYIKKSMSHKTIQKIKGYISNKLLKNKNWICRWCSDNIKRQKLPNRALVNNLEVSEIPLELKRLNNLERHLIALRLPFMKIVNLTSGKISNRFSQKGAVGPLHCVPSDVQDSVSTLPRPVDKSMMIRLQLKRRLKYKAVWEEQFVNPKDIRDALLFLNKEHPAYKDIEITDINENYIVSDKEEAIVASDDVLVEDMNVVEDEKDDLFENAEKQKHLSIRLALGDVNDNSDDEEILEDRKDTRTKYSIGTDCCIQPADFSEYLFSEQVSHVIAPAEKNKLSSLLTDKSIEKLAFPHLFPNSHGTYEEERETIIYWKEYCKARLFSSDSRFASDSSYIFFLQYLGDLKQAFSGMNIAFRKKIPMTVKESLDDTQIRFLMSKDMIFRYLQSVRGSPQFWNQRLKDLFGMNRQVDHPTFFVTLSSADLRWKEFIDTFIRHSGEAIKDSYTFEEKSKLLRANPVLAARMFERRLNNFMNMFIKGGARCLGPVNDWFYRIEMQMRGSPHAHMPLWVKDAPKYRGVDTDEKTREDIVKFCDKYITTKFPSYLEDSELHDLIKEVQMHSRNHSKSCLKCNRTICRFGFPRPIARRTFICEPYKAETEEDKIRVKKAKAILIEINTTLNMLEKDRELSWSDFDSLLEKYNWTYDDYEWSLRCVHSRAVIIHKREPNARWVNQYNTEMLKAWNANMDIQFVLNPYACAKYLMSYTTKPEREMSLLLEATHKECREGNMTVREEMKKLTGTFFNHRQISVQEAIYRATKMPLTYSSRGFVFVPAHSNSCRFLKSQKALEQMNPEDKNIYMSNLADKYFDRPVDSEFDICMADFASEYEIISINKKVANPKTPIKQLQTLKFSVKKRCGRNAIIRYPYFNRETDKENYYENLLSLYLPIRSREELQKPYELFFEKAEVFDAGQKCVRRVKEIVNENRKKYEAHFHASEEIESLFKDLSTNTKADDWAEIVANTEKNRIWRDDLEQDENPDFDMMRKKKENFTLNDLKQTCIPTHDMKPLLESMNEEQQEIFYYVRSWCLRRLHNNDVEPLHLFITGGAGTGKSHLLKCLHYEATRIFSQKKYLELDESIDEIHTLITAFTGAAAVNVNGVTIHSAFGISTNRDRLYDSLSCDKLNSYRCKLGSLKLLFVDEVSLIQASLWGAMHSRLTQIKGICSNTAIFGNIGIIAIGDFYQCSPVASSGIHSTLLWYDHFEYVELQTNERQKNVYFSQMLNRIRKLKKKDDMLQEDRDILEKCHQRYLNKEYHSEALHLFAKNIEVDAHNTKMIDRVCTDIRTFHETDGNGKQIKINKVKQQNNICKSLRLAVNARVMITKNICVSDGLANGVMGRVVGFIENTEKEVSHVLIKCDSKTAGRLHRTVCSYCRGKDTVCLMRESDLNERQSSDLPCRSITKQFPLRLSWAITVHKAQGLTVDEVVISTKSFFGSGMGYTGLSRNRTSEGLFLSDLHIEKFYCDDKIDQILTKMKPMKKNVSIFQDSPQFLNIMFHNIEGLNSNFIALRNYYLTKRADLICLAETWLTDKINIEQFQIDGYNFIHRTRASSFELNDPLHSQKGGGVCIYYRKNLQIKEIDLPSIRNFEHVAIELEKQNIIIVTCYRSPRTNKTSFLENLTSYLEKISLNKRILVIGDLNEDSFQNNSKTIESQMHALGFQNVFKNLSTTNSLTSLDCVYSNFISGKNQHQEVTGTFYSFHEAVIFSVNFEPESKSPIYENECLSEKTMEADTSETIPCPILESCATMPKRKHDSTEIEAHKKIKITTA